MTYFSSSEEESDRANELDDRNEERKMIPKEFIDELKEILTKEPSIEELAEIMSDDKNTSMNKLIDNLVEKYNSPRNRSVGLSPTSKVKQGEDKEPDERSNKEKSCTPELSGSDDVCECGVKK